MFDHHQTRDLPNDKYRVVQRLKDHVKGEEVAMADRSTKYYTTYLESIFVCVWGQSPGEGRAET